MIVRIVRLSFDPSFISVFEAVFNRKSQFIRNQPGCLHLELWQQTHEPNVFMTYSHWTDEDALNRYRNSDNFKMVWAKMKGGFNEKPRAWTLEQRQVVHV